MLIQNVNIVSFSNLSPILTSIADPILYLTLLLAKLVDIKLTTTSFYYLVDETCQIFKIAFKLYFDRLTTVLRGDPAEKTKRIKL